MAKSSDQVARRKKDHLKIALSGGAQIGDAGFGRYRFIHNGLPEIDFDQIDLSTKFLGKKVNFPFFISCMSGGIAEGARMNRNLAKAAQKFKIAMGVGSQRAAIENPSLAKTFEIRKYAPDIVLMANLGLVQLNYGYGLAECKKAVDMIGADALVFHLNPIQEAIQPEGDRNFEKLLPKLEKIVRKLSVPVIIKEVGFGLSEDVVRRLYRVGVRIFDTAGWGGTNWAYVEDKRRPTFAEGYGEAREDRSPGFVNWGLSTTDSIIAAKKVKVEKRVGNVVILGSGGVRTGVDVAKCLALGADLVGLATPFAKAALKSQTEVESLIERLALELKMTMFGVGAKNINSLQKAPLNTP